ncbi:saccharopine dehydrogenase NADP-binding domain-containing protein [Pseudomonas matsuisoli]|uniref:Saccharopine dehydrogenase NADP binding domain-containing protein n=1 Tax=Pseudomonas matsuisoli TaxID=1515666 RepID=A0A917PPM2_9PSED|nr:saccharopine dehydrogenase NADP-binding domain-containing protein [Pseudomonas matsuisoli]GGJ87007.1 hypothetical protein GCM10009304_11220 [Pseudomonas matsuisoli]
MSVTDHEKPVLILGGHGRVGQVVVRHLLAHSDVFLQVASRRNPVIPDEQADRVQGIALDVFDAKALHTAVGRARLVIACIGPSGVIGDRVAHACCEAGVPLVDAGGYDPLLTALEAREQERPASVPLLISVGLMPGLTGLFPRYVMDRTAAGRAIERLSTYCIGRDAWTYNSAWDIVHSLGDFGQDRGFPVIRNGRHESVGFLKATRKTAFGGDAGSVTTMLMPSEELARLARQLAIPEARAYGSNVGSRAAMVCGVTKMLGLYRSTAGIERSARWLERASRKDLRRLEPLYGLKVEVAYADGAEISATLRVTDTYLATGAVIAISALCLLEGEPLRAGVQMLHEAFDSRRFMRLLDAEGLITVDGLSPSLSVPAQRSHA